MGGQPRLFGLRSDVDVDRIRNLEAALDDIEAQIRAARGRLAMLARERDTIRELLAVEYS